MLDAPQRPRITVKEADVEEEEEEMVKMGKRVTEDVVRMKEKETFAKNY